MSTENSGSESEVELESLSQSINESIIGCYLNEPEYTPEEIWSLLIKVMELIKI